MSTVTEERPFGSVQPGPEPTRARHPDEDGYVERDGVRLFYEVYGSGEPTLLFFYPWAIDHSRAWKAQIPYLARHFRVVTFDQRGNGRSDRPRGVNAYKLEEHAADVLAVMDATGTERAALVSVSMGARAALWLAGHYPERIAGAALIGSFVPITTWPPERTRRRIFTEPRASRRALRTLVMTVVHLPHIVRSRSLRRFMRQVHPLEAFNKFTLDYIVRDQRGFLEWLVSDIACPDPHSTRQIEDAVGRGMETDVRTLVDSFVALDIDESAVLMDRDEILACCAQVRCPVLVVHGEYDVVSPPEWGEALAQATGGRLVWIERTGHEVRGRKPVAVNIALREFAESLRMP